MDADELRAWLHESFAPGVLVLNSERANDAAQRNEMNLAELLGPFGRAEGKVHFRTSTQPYGLEDFRVEFVSAKDLEPVPAERAEAALQKAVQGTGHAAKLDELLRQGPRENADMAHFARDTCDAPWYRAYRMAMVRTFQHHETRMFGHPTSFLCVISTADEDPAACFEQFVTGHFLPSAFSNERCHYNPSMPRFYLLLHDKSDPRCASVDLAALRQQLSATLPPNAFFVLELENDLDAREGVPDKAELQRTRSAQWDKHCGKSFFDPAQETEGPPPPPRGHNLTEVDIAALRQFGAALMQRVVGELESQLLKLDALVTEKRKGLRNQVRRFWRPNARSPGRDSAAADTGAGNPGGLQRARYRFDSIEATIRFLADLAFMMQDYDMALSNYRIAREDFASDRALLHHGAALEMMALSTFMKKGSNDKVLEYLRSAQRSFKEHLDAARQIPSEAERGLQIAVRARFLTNATMHFVDMVLASGSGNTRLYREGTEMLARASLDETPLAAAVLLEETGMFLLYQELASSGHWTFQSARSRAMPSPEARGTITQRLRKFGFHLVMASRLYGDCGNGQHAMRCLAHVRNIYGGRWTSIANHIDLNIGEHALRNGNAAGALPFWSRVLERGQSPSPREAKLLADFRANLASAEPAEWTFGLPAVQDQGIRVLVQRNASAEPPLSHCPSADLVEQAITAETVQQQRQHEEESSTPLREAQKITPSAARLEEERAWKALRADLDKCAPMDGDAVAARPRRRGRGATQEQPETCFIDEPLFVDVPMENPCAGDLQATELQLVAELVRADGTVVPVDEALSLPVVPVLTLAPKEQRMVRLSLTPLQAGSLRIHGARWKLFGSAPVFREFHVEGPRLNDTMEHRVAGARAPDLRLQKAVEPSSAWLGAEIQLPEQAVEGELLQTEIDLINLGRTPVKGPVVAACNLPCLCVGAESADVQCVVQNTARTLDEAGRAFELPIRNLETGSPVALPVCVRVPRSAGLCFLRVLLKYNDGRVTRELRLSLRLRIRASLKVRGVCFPSPLRLGEHLLSVSVKNISNEGRTFRLAVLSGLSAAWRIAEVPDEDASPVVPPGETITMLFQVTSAAAAPTGEKAMAVSEVVVEPQPAGTEEITEACRCHFVCLENAQRVLEARGRARDKHLRYKDSLQEEGKLPVSIQEIRRLNRALDDGSEGDPELRFLAVLEAKSKAAPGEPEPCAPASLVWGSRERSLHLVLQWREDGGQAIGQSEMLNVRVEPPHPFALAMDHPSSLCRRTTQVTVRVFNVSHAPTEEVVMEAARGDGFVWLGRTRLRVPPLAPGEEFSLPLTAVFLGSGEFNLNTMRILPAESSGAALTFPDRFFVIVHNHLDTGLEVGPPEPAVEEPELNQQAPAPSLPAQQRDADPLEDDGEASKSALNTNQQAQGGAAQFFDDAGAERDDEAVVATGPPDKAEEDAAAAAAAAAAPRPLTTLASGDDDGDAGLVGILNTGEPGTSASPTDSHHVRFATDADAKPHSGSSSPQGDRDAGSQEQADLVAGLQEQEGAASSAPLVSVGPANKLTRQSTSDLDSEIQELLGSDDGLTSPGDGLSSIGDDVLEDLLR